MRVDVVGEPAEVLAEEAGHECPDEEEGAADRQPRGHAVEPVRVGVEVGRGEGLEVLLLTMQLSGDLHQMVADVAEVLLRAAREAGQVEDRLRAGEEMVALGHDAPVELLHVLLEAVDLGQLLVPGLGEQHLRLDRVDALLERLDGGIEGVGQDVEDAVDDVVLGLRVRRVELVVELVQLRAGRAPDGHDERARDVDVDLDRLDRRHPRLGRAAGRVVDDEDVVAVLVELRPLAELDRVLERDGVQAEDLADHLQVLGAGLGEVEPEELVALVQLREPLPVDGLQHLHGGEPIHARYGLRP